MKTSTLLVLLGLSIIAVSVVSFASFILSTGTSGPYVAPAGSLLSVAVLLGLGQIIIGRALQPASVETEKEERKERQKLSQPSSSKARGRTEEEAPRIIAVDDQEPSAWLKTTLEKLAEQGSERDEENVTPAELSREPIASSRPRTEERGKPVPVPPPKAIPPNTPSKVRGTLVNQSELSRPTPRKEPSIESKPRPEETVFEPESMAPPAFETPIVTPPPQDEDRPGLRRLKEMEITFVERDGITFLEPGTGIHERYPCDDQTIIDFAWRALVRGLKVNAEVDSGKVIKLTSAS